MTNVGNLAVQLALDQAKFTSDIGRVVGQVENAGKRMQTAFRAVAGALLPAFTIGAVVGWTREMVRAAEELQDLSEATGSSVEELSRLSNIAKVSGEDFGTFKTAIERLAAGMAGAEEGSSKTADALKFLGVTAKDPALALTEIAGKLDRFADGANKAALAKDLFGRSGVAFISTLKQIANAGDVAATVTSAQAAEAVKLAEAYRSLEINATEFRNSLLSAIVPALANTLEEMREGTKAAGGFFEAIRLFGTINPFRDIAGNLREIRTEIDEINGAIKSGFNGGLLANPVGVGLEAKLSDLRKQEAFLKFQQRQSALALINPGNDDSRDIRARFKPALSYVSGDKPRKGKTDDPTRALFEGQIQAIKDFADQEQALLRNRLAFIEAHNAAGFSSFRDYFAEKSRAEADSLRVTLSALDQEIAKREEFKNRRGATLTEQAQADNDIAKLRSQRLIEESQATAKVTLGWFEQTRAAADYKRQLDEVSAKLLELQGDTAGATALRLKGQNAELRRIFQNNGDTAAVAKLEEAERLTQSFADMSVAQDDFSRSLASLGLQQERISLARETGHITELESLGKISEANKAILETLREQEARYAAIAATLTGPAQTDALQKLEQIRLQIDKVGAQTDLVGDKFTEIFKDSISGPLKDAINGTVSFADAVDRMVDRITDRLTDIAVDNILDSFFGKKGAGGGLGSAFGSMFGGGGGGGGFGDLFGWLSGLLGFADGGYPPVGRMSIVGERGPELIMPRGAMQVIPNHAMGGKSVQVTQNFAITGEVDRRSQTQIAAEAYRGLMRAHRAL